MVDQLLGAQIPVLSWWALATTLTKAATTLTMLAILILGIVLFSRGETTVGGIVMFMSFAGMLIQRMEQSSRNSPTGCSRMPRLEEFFRVFDTVPGSRDRKRAVTLDKIRGAVAFERVGFSYDGRSLRWPISASPPSLERSSPWSARPARANPRPWRCSIASTTRNRAASASTAATFATSSSRACAGISA